MSPPEYAGLPALPGPREIARAFVGAVPPLPAKKRRGRGPDREKRAPGSGGARHGAGKKPRIGPRAVAVTVRVPRAVAESFRAGASAAGMSQPKFFAEAVEALRTKTGFEAAVDSFLHKQFGLEPPGIHEGNTPQVPATTQEID